MTDTNTVVQGDTSKTQLATISTLTHGEDIFDVDRVGLLDNVTTHGEAVVVYVNEKLTRADVLAVGKKGQTYIARTPRPTDVSTPKLTVNGTTAKITSYERGVFPAYKNAPNVAPRKIATRKLTDPTVTLTSGETITLEGVWHIIAMVKELDNGRKLRVTHVVKSDTVPQIPCVNA